MSGTQGRCRGCRASFAPEPTGRPRIYCSPACRKAAARVRARVKPYHLTGTDEWGTPPEIFDPLHDEFGFTLDVCATDGNAKCERYFTKADDALAKLWVGVCWMNPPYSEVARWVAKAVRRSSNDAASSSTSTRSRRSAHSDTTSISSFSASVRSISAQPQTRTRLRHRPQRVVFADHN